MIDVPDVEREFLFPTESIAPVDLCPSSVSGAEFMPPSLLESQLDTLEHLQPDEDGMDVDVDEPVDALAAQVVARLGLA